MCFICSFVTSCYTVWSVVHLRKCFRMCQILVLLCMLVATVCGTSVPLLRPMSQEMIDFINNEAQTTWKVLCLICSSLVCAVLCIGLLILSVWYLIVAVWRSGNGVGRINEVTLRRARLVLGWLTCPGSTPAGGTLFRYVTSQPGRLSLSSFYRSINWVVSCNRMCVSLHGWRHLVKAYGVKAWCGWLERWCVC